MDAQELRNLSEAYLEVYSEIDEAKVEADASDVVKKDIRSRRFVGSKGEKNYDAMGPTASNWVSAARLRAHKAARGVKKEDFDVYDLILSHLLDEGYAETPESAEAIMVNMSEDWRESVVEAYKELPVDRMIRQTGTKQFKHGMRVGSGSSMNPKVPAQVGKMSYTALTHDPEKAKAKSKLKKN